MKKRLLLVILAIILLSFPALKSFFGPGLFEAHDTAFHLTRMHFMNKELREGQFPVRWLGDLNWHYGYPTFNFYYPAPYYLAQPFLFARINTITTYKIMITLTYILSAFFMFLWARNYWGDFGAFISSVLYLYTPYRFISLYVNGTYGVAVAFAIVPLVFWSLYLLFKKNRFRYLALTSLSLGLLVLTHNATAVMFSLPIASYLLYLAITSKKKKQSILTAIASILLSLYFLSFFILPIIFDLPVVKMRNPQHIAFYKEHFPTFKQLLYSPWGYGFSLGGPGDGMSFQLGIAQWLVVAVVTFLVILTIKKKIKEKKLILVFLTNFFLIFFFMLQQSSFVWERISFLQRLQFPWKLLAAEIFIVAFLTGSFVKLLKNQVVARGLCLLVIALALYGNRNHLRPATFDRRDQNYFIKFPYISDISAELSPVWNRVFPWTVQGQNLAIVKGEGKLEKIERKGIFYKYKASIFSPSRIAVGSLYFPGWNVYIDNEKTDWQIEDDSGVFSFDIMPGNHLIEVKFEDTFVRTLGNYLSLIGILLLVILIIKNEKISL